MRLQHPIRFARFLAILGVGSSILLAGLLFLSAFVRAVVLTIESIPTIGRQETFSRLIVAAVEHADVLLIATGLLIIGIGLYSIFIGQVERLPRRLAITGLNDLKDKLTGIVVVALPVRFFTVALEWNGQANVLGFGLGIAAVCWASQRTRCCTGTRTPPARRTRTVVRTERRRHQSGPRARRQPRARRRARIGRGPE